MSDAPRELPKTRLLGLTQAETAKVVAALGERDFRARQLFAWIYGRAESDFSAMSDLSAALRAKLRNNCRVGEPAVLTALADARGDTAKLLLGLDDGARIEAVRIGSTLCVSTQAGCRFGCAFCRTGAHGFARNLDAGEILGQWLAFRRHEPARRIDRVVYMGMGEPLDNLAAVERSIALFTDPAAVALGGRRITVSTVGIPPGIDRLAALGVPLTLAISLHAPDNALRDRLVPANRRHPIQELLAAAERYFARTGRRVTWEYTLLSGVNDTRRHALELARLLTGAPAHVNLIRMNAFPEAGFAPSDPATARAFRDALKERGVNATIRASRGGAILAACGQLATGKG